MADDGRCIQQHGRKHWRPGRLLDWQPLNCGAFDIWDGSHGVIFSHILRMNIHLPAIWVFFRVLGFWCLWFVSLKSCGYFCVSTQNEVRGVSFSFIRWQRSTSAAKKKKRLIFPTVTKASTDTTNLQDLSDCSNPLYVNYSHKRGNPGHLTTWSTKFRPLCLGCWEQPC